MEEFSADPSSRRAERPRERRKRDAVPASLPVSHSDDIIQLKDQFYVLATSSLADQRTRVLREGEAFAVFDIFGNIQPIGAGTQGLYDGATRFLSYFDMRLRGVRPLLLSSSVRSDNTLLTVDMMNRSGETGFLGEGTAGQEGTALPGTLHVFRTKFLWERVCYERLQVANYGTSPVTLFIAYRYRSDFADIFEIRGTRRAKRGQLLEPEIGERSVVLGYEGLDGEIRRTRILASPAPAAISRDELSFQSTIEPRRSLRFFVAVGCEYARVRRPVGYSVASRRMTIRTEAARSHDCQVETSNTQFNQWLDRSRSDLFMMISQTPYGPYPYAGVPLFNTVFGRDGLITAHQSLWFNPDIARGVLTYLAKTQAVENNSQQDAEPGKILHEVRSGEMVALGEVPFRCYYGSADSTPLFLLLAGEYWERTGDEAFLRDIWPNIEAAAEWIDRYGDVDQDGLVEYVRRNPQGLSNQGWKDSHDSIFHRDGSLAVAPIALCEIQAYVYAAKLKVASMAGHFGRPGLARELAEGAEKLRTRFEEAFWCDTLSTYALALDADKKPCEVRASNAGHCLFGGIASPERALRTALTLLGSKMFAGWGIRTIAEGEARYNPMSYHNGSVWPHDNSLVVDGLCRYGFKELANRVLVSLFEAALFMDQNRLPELFCGFGRRQGEGPTLYPVACSPQSWASASGFLMLKAVLGLSIRAHPAQVRFFYPELPAILNWVKLRGLSVGNAKVDLLLERHTHGVGVTVLQKVGEADIILVK